MYWKWEFAQFNEIWIKYLLIFYLRSCVSRSGYCYNLCNIFVDISPLPLQVFRIAFAISRIHRMTFDLLPIPSFILYGNRQCCSCHTVGNRKLDLQRKGQVVLSCTQINSICTFLPRKWRKIKKEEKSKICFVFSPSVGGPAKEHHDLCRLFYLFLSFFSWICIWFQTILIIFFSSMHHIIHK